MSWNRFGWFNADKTTDENQPRTTTVDDLDSDVGTGGQAAAFEDGVVEFCVAATGEPDIELKPTTSSLTESNGPNGNDNTAEQETGGQGAVVKK